MYHRILIVVADHPSSQVAVAHGLGLAKALGAEVLFAHPLHHYPLAVADMPPSRVLRSLMKAARRGVDVTLILAGSTDVPLVLLGSRGLYPKLIRSGVRVAEPIGHAR